MEYYKRKKYKYITKNNVLKTAQQILYLWQEIIDNSNNNPWYKLKQRQAYRDCLEIMRKNNLIKDYSLGKEGITQL